MTEREALQITVDLWGWLHDNPDSYKEDWPEWVRNGGNTRYVQSGCALCAFARPDCRKCPLLSTWSPWYVRILKKSDGPCESIGSPYSKWKYSTRPDKRKKYAGIIRDAAAYKLLLLEGE